MAVEVALQDENLTVVFPFTREQRYQIYEAVRDDIETYQPGTLPQRDVVDLRR
jgi:hypothetical protein